MRESSGKKEWLKQALLGALLVAALCFPAPGRAEERPADTERAVARGHEALELFQAGAWMRAHAAFAEAESLAHSPVFVLYMARSLRNAGRLLAARSAFERLTREVLPPNRPGPWEAALRAGRNELEQLKARIPRVRVVIRPALPPHAVVEVGGVRIEHERLGTPIELDPGRQVVSVRDDFRLLAVEELMLDDDRRETLVELRLSEEPKPSRSARRPLPAPMREPAAAKWQRPLGYGALALAAIGVGVGSVTGLMALDEAKSVRGRCKEQRCPPGARDDRDHALMLANVSTAGFVAGGVGLAGAATLLLIAPFTSRDETNSMRAGVTCSGTF